MMIREEEMKGKGQKNLDSIFRSQSLCCEVGKSRHVRDTFCFNEHREIAIYFEKQCIDYMEMTSIKNSCPSILEISRDRLRIVLLHLLSSP